MEPLRRNAAFVRLFLGRLVTNAGDSLYFVGAMWLVYELTGSSLYTGVAGFLVQAPSALQFLAGPLVDRWRLRPVLVATQVVNGVCVLAVPLAAATGHLSVWVVLTVLPVLSLVNQFVYPAQSAALPRLVSDDQLVRANSLFSTAYKTADVAFNAAGGLVIAAVGATTLFAVDSVTFAVAAALFSGVAIPETSDGEDSEESDEESYLAELREGVAYLRGSVVLRLVVGMMVVNLGSGAMTAVLPAFADSFGGPGTYGLLTATLVAGPLAGSAGASLVDDVPYGRVAVAGPFFSGACLAVAVAAPGLLPTLALFPVAFVPLGVTNVMYGSMLQSSVDDAILGRVRSVSSSVAMVMVPTGSLVGGVGASAFGPTGVLFGFAGLQLLLGVYYLATPRIRSLPSVEETDEGTLGLGVADCPDDHRSGRPSSSD